MINWLFDGWNGPARISVMAVCSYVLLILLLRVTGKRTLSKLNAFDLVITMALGSALSTVILDDSISLSEGVMAMAMLIFLQYIVTWSTYRIAALRKLVKAQPTLIYYNGAFLEPNMRKERVMQDDIRQAVRDSGHADMKDVQAVILEADGSLAVLTDTGDLARL